MIKRNILAAALALGIVLTATRAFPNDAPAPAMGDKTHPFASSHAPTCSRCTGGNASRGSVYEAQRRRALSLVADGERRELFMRCVRASDGETQRACESAYAARWIKK